MPSRWAKRTTEQVRRVLLASLVRQRRAISRRGHRPARRTIADMELDGLAVRLPPLRKTENSHHYAVGRPDQEEDNARPPFRRPRPSLRTKGCRRYQPHPPPKLCVVVPHPAEQPPIQLAPPVPKVHQPSVSAARLGRCSKEHLVRPGTYISCLTCAGLPGFIRLRAVPPEGGCSRDFSSPAIPPDGSLVSPPGKAS